MDFYLKSTIASLSLKTGKIKSCDSCLKNTLTSFPCRIGIWAKTTAPMTTCALIKLALQGRHWLSPIVFLPSSHRSFLFSFLICPCRALGFQAVFFHGQKTFSGRVQGNGFFLLLQAGLSCFSGLLV